MPQITIDGQVFDAEAGQTIIEVATNNGVEIPHFCWHPALSVSGNCRMCLVDVGLPKMNPDRTPALDEQGKPVIQYAPKLSIACSTQISDGMHVRTKDAKVKSAQESVMEFLLINHPLDCPICDEAGQCKLQEYSFRHSKGESRFAEEKNHKNKRVKLGPNVLFDAERCISCSRCIRYANEKAEQPVLNFIQRGDHVTIETFPGTEFDSPYSMNVIEICPVGALTSADFRFKARVWDMSFNDTVCLGCARGCNAKAGVRNNELLRLEPRPNLEVNEYWMCDYGRLSQTTIVNENRISAPMFRHNGELVPTSWDKAITETASILQNHSASEILVLASPYFSNEENYALQKFAASVLKTAKPQWIDHQESSFGDEKLRRADKTPNSAGVAALGLEKTTNLLQNLRSGAIKALITNQDDLAAFGSEVLETLRSIPTLILFASHQTEITSLAHVVLSRSTYAEQEGTWTNFQQRVQHSEPCIITRDNESHMGMKMSRLDKFGAHNDRWTQGERRDCRPVWRIAEALALQCGGEKNDWRFRVAEDVFEEIADTVPFFVGMTYQLLDERKGVVSGETEKTDSPRVEYYSHTLTPH